MAHLSQSKTSFDSVGSHIFVGLGHRTHGAVLSLFGPMAWEGFPAQFGLPFQQT
jgi:hypothetical protein